MNLGNSIRPDAMATAVLVFAHHIGIDINEEESLMHIASGSLQDLPEGWELGIPRDDESNAGIPYFFHTASGESVWEHPLEKEILARVRTERIQLKCAPKVKVISRRQSLTSKAESLFKLERIDEKPLETAFNFSPAKFAPSEVGHYSKRHTCSQWCSFFNLCHDFMQLSKDTREIAL